MAVIYEIWSEGYRATGESARAMCHGTAEGQTFQRACEHFALENPEFSRYFNRVQLTYWGCRLFDNSVDARKSFG